MEKLRTENRDLYNELQLPRKERDEYASLAEAIMSRLVKYNENLENSIKNSTNEVSSKLATEKMNISFSLDSRLLDMKSYVDVNLESMNLEALNGLSSYLRNMLKGLKSVLNVEQNENNTTIQTNEELSVDNEWLHSARILEFLESWKKRDSYNIHDFLEYYFYDEQRVASISQKAAVIEIFTVRFQSGIKKPGERLRCVKKSSNEQTFSLVSE